MAKMTEKELKIASDEELMERYGYLDTASKSLPLKSQRKSFRTEATKLRRELRSRGHSKEQLKRFV